jgi:hypothetical protein
MQWQEVRNIYPDQYVLLKILNSRTEDNVQYVDNIVYHTGQEKIAVELRKNPFR